MFSSYLLVGILLAVMAGQSSSMHYIIVCTRDNWCYEYSLIEKDIDGNRKYFADPLKCVDGSTGGDIGSPAGKGEGGYPTDVVKMVHTYRHNCTEDGSYKVEETIDYKNKNSDEQDGEIEIHLG